VRSACGYDRDVAGIGEEHPERIAAELRARRRLLERHTETYVARADYLADQIAALEAAQRLAVAAEDVEFSDLLKRRL
jgi:hypothetical protein